MKRKIAVLYGGRSGEHEVSLRSAESIINALDPERYEVVRYFISKEGKWDPRPIVPEPDGNPGIDVVFPVLHGTFGEDGTMQGLFELAGLPYVGPGVLASSAAMDKEVTKRLCVQAGLPVVDYAVAKTAYTMRQTSRSGSDIRCSSSPPISDRLSGYPRRRTGRNSKPR